MDESIIENLEKIKEFCKKQSDYCLNCPLSNINGDCLICKNIPKCWKINKEPIIKYLKKKRRNFI